MGGGLGGLGAAALVDGDVDDDRALLHLADHVAGDELGGVSAGNQDGADDEVGLHDLFLDRVVGGVDRLQHGPELLVEFGQAVEVLVDHGDPGLQAHRHAGGVGADDAAADHDDLGGRHSGNTAEQLAAATVRDLEAVRAGLDGHPPRDFGHRSQQWQSAAVVGHSLVGDGYAAGVDESLGLHRVGRQVQVGEQDLVGTQHGSLDRLRLFDLDDHVGALEDLFGGVDDLGAGGLVHLVVQADLGGAVTLHHDLMAVGDQVADRGRRQSDAVLVDLDLFGDADQHGFSSQGTVVAVTSGGWQLRAGQR